ncbi:hypothetical protein [Formosa sp. PL04]|uniref:hypothetical protein n=1 Tax=Formosa sp. PL04 TaxID=3081755 RepID=UPI002981912D|nr:hypothetical protein [Formosa sp. PL04]MDW5290122.1 hypothetical protein [Formosa sp. PL04]
MKRYRASILNGFTMLFMILVFMSSCLKTTESSKATRKAKLMQTIEKYYKKGAIKNYFFLLITPFSL